ncbi:hypothetical protein ATANTOWER_017916 [Ataeniobius toweri]|uniref:Uncharacterized protein n=1 Tax=Ataeniobius toweri TaxID=208326 RepID=A0ABU7A8A7_9TELE|nr:hypothetical protein [Ataeniobius toweri]
MFCVSFDFVYLCVLISCQAPRIEAQTILGSLVCFPNLYLHIPVLHCVPGSNNISIGNEDIKDYLVNILLEAATKEYCEGARCIAVCSLGLWVCEELMQKNIHHRVKDAINVLGVTLKMWANLSSYISQLPARAPPPPQPHPFSNGAVITPLYNLTHRLNQPQNRGYRLGGGSRGKSGSESLFSKSRC